MQALYPVIMCGGAGTRLWPASRPSRPKQFIRLVGELSLFQETARRVAPLVCDGGRLIVVGGVGHRELILRQLGELGIDAQVLLEPQPRDSAAAMAAAAAWTARENPIGVNVFVASDHHIPDHEAFCAAARLAATAAFNGRIVTLGVRPTSPSSAYGYIAPAGPGLSSVTAFVEKPGTDAAARYIRDGYLWNSGIFIVTAATLIDELNVHAREVLVAAQAALPESGTGSVATLSKVFLSAPKISIDYAVMERTSSASVLAVDFDWSDLGAWDAVAEVGTEEGAHILEDASGCLIRAPEGVAVAAVGVRDLAIIVEADAVLVCSLSHSQNVKAVVERLRVISPEHLDFPDAPEMNLADGGAQFTDWMRLRALPTWSAFGQDACGGFRECLGLDGRLIDVLPRARVQTRQIHSFIEAGRLGWNGPWRHIAERGLERLYSAHLRADGLMHPMLERDGAPSDAPVMLYDQAFLLLALASAKGAGLEGDHEAAAVSVRNRLLADGPVTGGLKEQGEQPFQSNPQMHLLEACLGWEAVSDDPGWSALADRIARLACEKFIDAEGGFLREFFAADWSPAVEPERRWVEPGHQFEWAWLLARHSLARGTPEGMKAARRLYAYGLRGIDPLRAVAVDALNEDGGALEERARLWPQTEWLKAASPPPGPMRSAASNGARNRSMRSVEAPGLE